jgi:hypothetical protein
MEDGPRPTSDLSRVRVRVHQGRRVEDLFRRAIARDSERIRHPLRHRVDLSSDDVSRRTCTARRPVMFVSLTDISPVNRRSTCVRAFQL